MRRLQGRAQSQRGAAVAELSCSGRRPAASSSTWAACAPCITQVKDKPGRSRSARSSYEGRSAAVEKQADEIKAQLRQVLQGVTSSRRGGSDASGMIVRSRMGVRLAADVERSLAVEALPQRLRACRADRPLGRCWHRSRLLLCVLIVLPMGWLVVFAFTDRPRNVDARQLRHAVHRSRPSSIRWSPRSSSPPRSALICCARRRADGLARGAHRHAAARAPCALLVMASFVTPPFLGAIAWELLAAPNSGLLNQLYRAADRRRPGRGAVQHLHADRA